MGGMVKCDKCGVRFKPAAGGQIGDSYYTVRAYQVSSFNDGMSFGRGRSWDNWKPIMIPVAQTDLCPSCYSEAQEAMAAVFGTNDLLPHMQGAS